MRCDKCNKAATHVVCRFRKDLGIREPRPVCERHSHFSNLKRELEPGEVLHVRTYMSETYYSFSEG